MLYASYKHETPLNTQQSQHPTRIIHSEFGKRKNPVINKSEHFIGGFSYHSAMRLYFEFWMRFIIILYPCMCVCMCLVIVSFVASVFGRLAFIKHKLKHISTVAKIESLILKSWKFNYYLIITRKILNIIICLSDYFERNVWLTSYCLYTESFLGCRSSSTRKEAPLICLSFLSFILFIIFREVSYCPKR